jgi:lipopolysaccharide export system permease protein
MLSLLIVDPHILSSWGLYRYINFMQDNGLNASSYQVAFWSKIATPLVILVMVFLAVPLLFGSLRGIGVGQRIFIGVLIGVAFYIVNQGFSQMAVVFSLNPALAAFAPGLLCLVAAIWVLRRVR